MAETFLDSLMKKELDQAPMVAFPGVGGTPPADPMHLQFPVLKPATGTAAIPSLDSIVGPQAQTGGIATDGGIPTARGAA